MLTKTIGIDLGKTVCDAVAMDARGKVLARRRATRAMSAMSGWESVPAPA